MTIQWHERKVSIADLKPYEKNPRKISDGQYQKLKQSLQQNGYHQRLIATPDMLIIGGHQRLKALAELGFTEINILVPDRALSEAEYKRMLVQDNLPFGEFDFDMLSMDFSFEELSEWGMTDDLLSKWKQPVEFLADPDAVPELPGDPISKTGDVWILGNHRLMCGDSTKEENVCTLLSGAKPHLMVTDPPYGVEYDSSWRSKVDGGSGKRNDAPVLNDDKADWGESYRLFPGEVAYIWHADRHASEVQKSLEESGFKIYTQIIWAKQTLVMSRGHYHWKHEPCWYAVRKNGTGHWRGDRKQTTLWEINNNNCSGGNIQEETFGHSTQKPIECMKRPIENNSQIGDEVYEPFSGSGTTIIAAEMTSRKCYAMEIHPAYVDMAVKRWEAFTGKKAIHETNRV